MLITLPVLYFHHVSISRWLKVSLLGTDFLIQLKSNNDIKFILSKLLLNLYRKYQNEARQ